MKKHTFMVALFVAVFALSGCTAVTGTGSSNDADADIPTGAELQVTRARQHLAAALSIDLSGVTVVEASPIEWSDSSLGCPEPGMSYLTVITPGYHIILEANGVKYNYHTDERDYFILCTDDRSVLETGDKDDMDDGSFAPGAEALTAEVKRDLANKLSVNLNSITVIEVTAVEWNDSSLGCPEPDMMYLMVITPGYRIVLEANGVKYNYHTDKDDYFVLCPNDRSEAGSAIDQ